MGWENNEKSSPSCSVGDERYPKTYKPPGLVSSALHRLQVGDEVECNLGSGRWAPGRVHALLYRDEKMPAGLVAPYRVRLEGEEGRLIFVPSDQESLVRAGKATYTRPPKTGGASGRRIPGIGAGPATIGRRIF